MNADRDSPRFWRYVRGLAAPVLLWSLFLGVLIDTMWSRLRGDDVYDEAALREWVEESRVFRETLPEMIREYLHAAESKKWPAESVKLKAAEIHDQLEALGNPTKMYQGQMLLFPAIYRLELEFNTTGNALAPIVWESKVPRPRLSNQVKRLEHPILGSDDRRAVMRFEYQLHAYNKRQRYEQAATARLRTIAVLAMMGTALAFFWIYWIQRRERERARQHTLTQQQINQAERLVLEGEVRRQEAERRHEEAERKLLEQRLATQAAEQHTLELKSQLYASIGIMAGSYAHNIKNLLVRPNDLLQRCLEADGLSRDQDYMLREVRQTLGTVTERLQQILQTVRRDPSRSEMKKIDLNAVAQDMFRTWEDLAREKWKLTLTLDLCPEPLWIEGDQSHLEQAVENLLFNARDATFEMRNQLRIQAHQAGDSESNTRRQALIAAAAWKGVVLLRTRHEGDRALLEVQDNGIGMTDEVRRHCTETHFSTKRDNAVYEGNTTGMGLGLSFVTVILEHHRAALKIESEPLQGALFQASFPERMKDEG